MGEARYSPWLDCGDVQVLAAERSDSALRDFSRLAASSGYAELAAHTAVALVVREPSRPVTARDVWPTPPGNLYAAFELDAPPARAAQLCTAAAAAVLRRHAPELRLDSTVSTGAGATAWGEIQAAVPGGQRVIGGVSVLAVLPTASQPAGRGRCGIDLHLRATAADYGNHAQIHASLRTLVGSSPAAEVAMADLVRILAPALSR